MMSMLPTLTTSTAVPRLRTSWPVDMPSAVSCALPCDRLASGATGGSAGTQISFDHMGTNHGVTTESKRLIPGHLDEVST